jgi:hypothetical protein
MSPLNKTQHKSIALTSLRPERILEMQVFCLAGKKSSGLLAIKFINPSASLTLVVSSEIDRFRIFGFPGSQQAQSFKVKFKPGVHGNRQIPVS